jgi:methylated-DNA-[protein]-cysteine S-methyltransferase
MIYTAYCPSPMGDIEISADDEHITSVVFTETERRGVLPAKEAGSNHITDACVRQLGEYFAGERRGFDLPLLQAGTDFQQRVWSKLMEVDFGSTFSYLELSRQLGDIKAIRAVGAANGKNKIWIIVPCHRIIGSDKKLVGYAGDLWRKKWLLDHEAKLSPVKTGSLF